MDKKALLDKYLGIPYRHKGRTMQGLDCWGFVILAYRDMGHEVLDVENYDENWSWKGKNLFIENYAKQWTRIHTPRMFDLAFFRNGKDIINHCAIYLDEGRIIHCCRTGVIISTIWNEPWRKRLEGFYRLK